MTCCPNCNVVFSDRSRSKLRNQVIPATTWTPQALWNGGDVDVFLQAIAGGAPVAFRLSTDAGGAAEVIDVPAGSGIELRSEPRQYWIYAAVEVTLQAIIEEAR